MENITISEKVSTPEDVKNELNRKNKFPPIVDKKTKETFPPTKETLKKSKDERTKLSNEKLQSISNREFLSISKERRLENITKNNIKSEKISDWTEKKLQFTFTFEWKFNKELYLKTTAGQVLPEEVWIVKKDWKTYERNNLSWEFFTSGGRRLIIKEWTEIEIEKIRTLEEIKNLKEKNNTSIKSFKETKDYKEGFDDIVSEAIKRGIEPKFAILAFGEKIKDLQMMSTERVVLIEDMFTEFDRKKGKISPAFKNKKQAVEISILKQFSSDWEAKAKEFGIKEEVIKEINESDNKYLNIDKNIRIEWNWRLNFIQRLRNTRNVAEDLNNPANLVAWWVWDKYAIWKYKSSNWHTFLVFRDIEHWFKAMSADIEAKQNWFSKVISKDASLKEFLKVWTWNWQWSISKRNNYTSIVLWKLWWNFSLNTKFANIDSFELSKALAKAEWFKWWNNLYKNYVV